MKPATKALIPLVVALILSGCQTTGLWQSNSSSQQSTAQQSSAGNKQPAVKLTLKQLIERDLAANRLSKPNGNNAIEKIERLREQSPGDTDIKRFEKSIINRYLALADQRIKRHSPPSRPDLEKALSYVNTARSLQVPSTALDNKEQEIIELLDIVIQQEQLAKARAAEATPPPEPVPAEPATVETDKPNPQLNNPNFIALEQEQISNRSQEINLQLDDISQRIVAGANTVVIHAQSMDDFRYLKSSLRTSLYWVDPDFHLNAEPHINEAISPGIEIITEE
ncbi:MAG: hypothetical protein CSA49_03850 [Gammaproteobacteria bacterium]|nr:MAG: hypothetical protein CSA49_03850 [Gammaproteobacteria bacterium]